MPLFFLIGFCILTMIGVAIATLVLLTILGLGFAGIISTSLIYGLYKKSLEKAFKLFMISGFGFCGMVSCAILFPVVNKIMLWTEFENALLSGLIIGISSGLLTGFIMFRILKALTKSFAEKLNLK